MDQQTCSQCGLSFAREQMVLSEAGTICLTCEMADTLPRTPFPWSWSLAGIVAGAGAALLHHQKVVLPSTDVVLSHQARVLERGENTTSDSICIGGGGVALVIGAALLFAALRVPKRWLLAGVSTLILSIGVTQLLYGFGVLL